MTVALPIEADDSPRPSCTENGVVAVHNYGLGHSAAYCSCGWTGRRRHLKAAAEQDAWAHSMRERCAISVPLVIPIDRIA
jgi:hypothetical protein